MRAAASSSRSPGTPEATAATTSSAASASAYGSGKTGLPMQTRSTPATRARTAPWARPTRSAIARMSRASLTTTPVNPSSSRSSRSTGALIVAGWSSRLRTTTWAVITQSTPRGDRRRERREVPGPVGGLVDVELGQGEVGVGTGGAVARVVLGAGHHSPGVQAAHEGHGVATHEHRVGAEGALADHRVVGLGVHVDDRPEHDVDAERPGRGRRCRGPPPRWSPRRRGRPAPRGRARVSRWRRRGG